MHAHVPTDAKVLDLEILKALSWNAKRLKSEVEQHQIFLDIYKGKYKRALQELGFYKSQRVATRYNNRIHQEYKEKLKVQKQRKEV